MRYRGYKIRRERLDGDTVIYVLANPGTIDVESIASARRTIDELIREDRSRGLPKKRRRK